MATVDIAATLRHYQPVSVRAYDAHDDVRDIAIPHGARTKWKRAAKTIEARPWVRLDLLDKGGKTLAHVDNDGPAEDIEELSAASSSATARDERMLALYHRITRDVRAMDSRENVELIAACREMMKVVTEGMRTLAEIQRAQYAALAELRSSSSEGGGTSEDELMKMLMPLIPALLARNPTAAAVAKVATAPAAPPNGKTS